MLCDDTVERAVKVGAGRRYSMSDDLKDLIVRAEEIEEEVAPQREPNDEDAPTQASSND